MHLSARQVEHQLISRHHRRAVGGGQSPVGMSAVEVAVLVDHLRLYPQTEPQSHIVDFFDKSVKSVRQLAFIRYPVSQSRVIVVAVFEPSVIEHKQLQAQVLCLFGYRDQFFFGKVEVCRFPVVDEHRTMAQPVFSAHYVIADHAVIVVREICQTVRAAEYDLGSMEGRFRRQLPAEAVVAYTCHDTHAVKLVAFDLCFVIARVHQHHAVAGAAVLRGFSVTQDNKRIMLMARHASARYESVYTVEQRHALRLTLHAVPSVKVYHIPLTERKLQTHRAGFSQPYYLIARVDYLGAACDDVKLFKDAVIQAYPYVGGVVDQGDDQRLRDLSAVIDRGQTRDRVLSVSDLMALISELRAAAAVGARGADAGHAEIANAEGGVLLRHGIQRIGSVLAHIVWVAGEAVIVDTERIGHIVLPELGTIVQMLQIAQLIDLHLISGILGF